MFLHTAAAATKSLQLCPTLCDPTRLPRPWDSLGKNTGVGCHFLLQCVKVKSESEVAQSCPTLLDPMDCRLFSIKSYYEIMAIISSAIQYILTVYVFYKW